MRPESEMVKGCARLGEFNQFQEATMDIANKLIAPCALAGWLAVALAAGMPACAQQAATNPIGLTVQQAVQLGLSHNPQAVAAAAAAAAAQATYRSLAAFPDLQLGVTRAQGSSTAPTLTGTTSDTSIDIGDVIDTSGQRRFQAAGAKATAASSRYQAAETNLTLAQQIRDAYWSLAAAHSLTGYASESLAEARHVYDLIKTQQVAGASPQVDVVRSSIDVANAEQALVTAQGSEKTALIALNTLLARPPLTPIALASDLKSGSAATASGSAGTAPDVAALTSAAISNRPLVKSTEEQIRVAEYAVKQAKATRLPDLSVDYQQSLEQPLDTVVLAIHLPLLDFGSTHYAVRSAEESVRQSQALRTQAVQQVAQQVAQAFQDRAQAQTLLTSYETDILNPSVKLRDMAQLGYQQGATGILPVIDAESTLRGARTGYVNSLLALKKAEDELMAAVGAGGVQ